MEHPVTPLLKHLVKTTKKYSDLLDPALHLEHFRELWDGGKPHPTTFSNVEAEIESALAIGLVRVGLTPTVLDMALPKAPEVAVDVSKVLPIKEAVTEPVVETTVISDVKEVVEKPALEETIQETKETETSIVDEEKPVLVIEDLSIVKENEETKPIEELTMSQIGLSEKPQQARPMKVVHGSKRSN